MLGRSNEYIALTLGHYTIKATLLLFLYYFVGDVDEFSNKINFITAITFAAPLGVGLILQNEISSGRTSIFTYSCVYLSATLLGIGLICFITPVTLLDAGFIFCVVFIQAAVGYAHAINCNPIQFQLTASLITTLVLYAYAIFEAILVGSTSKAMSTSLHYSVSLFGLILVLCICGYHRFGELFSLASSVKYKIAESVFVLWLQYYFLIKITSELEVPDGAFAFLLIMQVSQVFANLPNLLGPAYLRKSAVGGLQSSAVPLLYMASICSGFLSALLYFVPASLYLVFFANQIIVLFVKFLSMRMILSRETHITMLVNVFQALLVASLMRFGEMSYFHYLESVTYSVTGACCLLLLLRRRAATGFGDRWV